MKRTIPVLVLAVIVGVLWIASRSGRTHGGSAQSPSEKGDAAGTSGAVLDPRVEADGADVREAQSPMQAPRSPAVATSIGVRSSAGLKLAFVEIQEVDAPWQRRGLVEARCELEGVALPCRLRAPGHVPAAVEKLGGEIVLDPDALLVLTAPGLRGCVESIEPLRNWFGANGALDAEFAEHVARSSSSGFVDDDHWAIAVTGRLVGSFRLDRTLQVTLELHDRRHVDIDFKAHSGARASWSPPCSDETEVAPLDVTLVWPEGDEAGETDLFLWRVRETGAGEAAHLELPWGTIAISPLSRVSVRTRLKPGSRDAPLGPFPLHARCVLMAVDPISGDYGGMEFEHDGSARTLPMQKALAITGKLSGPPTVPPPARPWIRWEYRASVQSPPWYGSQRDVAMGANGEFEVRGLRHFPIELTRSLDPPPILDLTVDAPGFEPFHKTYSTGGARRFDCGEIGLLPRVPQLVLAPGHPIEERSLNNTQMRVSARPEIAWEIHNGQKESDGSLAIFLSKAHGGEPGQDRFEFRSDKTGTSDGPFPEAPGDFALLLDRTGEGGIAFRRNPDGRYEPVATRHCRLDLECRSMPSDDSPWSLGWKWKGLSCPCKQVTAEFEGERTQIDVTIPEDDVSLWWSGETGEGGTIPAAGSLVRVTLP